MKILIIDGHPKAGDANYQGYLQELADAFEASEHRAENLILRDLDVKYCVGCWGCWVKTPGRCIAKDDSHEVCRRVINSNFVLFVTPMIMGCQSALMKKTQDKLIPLVHPYIEQVRGESHHIRRYDVYPKMGLLLEQTAGSGDEDVEITADMFRRFALNIKNDEAWTWSMSTPPREVADEINRV